ncbi:MAG: hypothetical protein ACRESZ_11275 [Methylococcales bacterium]
MSEFILLSEPVQDLDQGMQCKAKSNEKAAHTRRLRAPFEFLISKMFQLSRHTGRDCRYPEHMDVFDACHPFWVPAIPAGTTVFGRAEAS